MTVLIHTGQPQGGKDLKNLSLTCARSMKTRFHMDSSAESATLKATSVRYASHAGGIFPPFLPLTVLSPPLFKMLITYCINYLIDEEKKLRIGTLHGYKCNFVM